MSGSVGVGVSSHFPVSYVEVKEKKNGGVEENEESVQL